MRLEAGFLRAPHDRSQEDGFELTAIIGEMAMRLAEDRNAKEGTLHKSWGCVGALFRQGAVHAHLSAGWKTNFDKVKAKGVSVVDAAGLLTIGWPDTLEGQAADFDAILATATKPEAKLPTAHAVADAWINQDGNENYFFQNVQNDIRTPDDREIWRRMEEKSPLWLEKKKQEYQPAIEILRSDFAQSVHDRL